MSVCAYCTRELERDGAPGLRDTRDHIIPKLLGDFGRNNTLRACADCNHLKGSRTPPEMLHLAEMLERQAVRWREMAAKVEEVVDARGLIAPWRKP